MAQRSRAHRHQIVLAPSSSLPSHHCCPIVVVVVVVVDVIVVVVVIATAIAVHITIVVVAIVAAILVVSVAAIAVAVVAVIVAIVALLLLCSSYSLAVNPSQRKPRRYHPWHVDGGTALGLENDILSMMLSCQKYHGVEQWGLGRKVPYGTLRHPTVLSIYS